ncbi:hypothetical protein B566_EDAN010630 [Ephemera danica]|nr:hypothetical protein B566_EDAN010630 [Ephemera danica]
MNVLTELGDELQGAERCSSVDDDENDVGSGLDEVHGSPREGSATLDVRSLISSCSGADAVSLGYEDTAMSVDRDSPTPAPYKNATPSPVPVDKNEEEEIKESKPEVEELEERVTISMRKAPSEPLGECLPDTFEQDDVLDGAAIDVGVAVEASAGFYGGALLANVLPGGAAHRDGRLQIGAELLELNQETLRHVDQAQALAILRRASLQLAEVGVTFVPPPATPTTVTPPSEFSTASPPLGSPVRTPVGETFPPPLAAPRAVSPVVSRQHSAVVIPSSLPGITSRQVIPATAIRSSSSRSPLLSPATCAPSSSSSHATVTNSRLQRTKTDSEEDTTCVTVISVAHGQETLPPRQESPLRGSLHTVISVAPHSFASELPPPPPLPSEPPPRRTSRTEIVLGTEHQVTSRLSLDSVLPAAAVTSPASLLQPHSTSPVSRSDSRGSEAMTVTQVSGSSVAGKKSAAMSGAGQQQVMSKHWGPERLVEILREPNCSLGISIVGGRVDLYNAGPDSGSAISGIFIKNVLPQSPAGRTGELKTGDRILEVDNINLRTASHERAVEVIRAAGNPVRFLVQSLIQWNVDGPESEAPSTSSTPTGSRTFIKAPPPPVPISVTPTPELIQEGVTDWSRQGKQRDSPPVVQRNFGGSTSPPQSPSSKSPPASSPGSPVAEKKSENRYSSSSEDEESEDDNRDLEGRTVTKQGQEIYRASAGNVKRSAEEVAADPEQEDEYGYTKSEYTFNLIV